ncbi:MAG: E3 binding domain-containing protein, partial [Halioglobus sp.]|nr:E3 binding domain-containing protein [Halioglobus sp.]
MDVPVQQVTVPDIGGAEGAEVIELLVAAGDEVVVDQGLIVLESDKASMEIPSTVAGTVVEMLVAEGDQLSEGAPLAKIEVSDEDVQAHDAVVELRDSLPITASDEKEAVAGEAEPADAAIAPVVSVPVEQVSAAAAAEGDRTTPKEIYAGPAVRRMARELGVSLKRVLG